MLYYKSKPAQKAKPVQKAKTKSTVVVSPTNATVRKNKTIDYLTLLKKYDIHKINESVIVYYKSLHDWIDELISQVEIYELENQNLFKSLASLLIELDDHETLSIEFSNEEFEIFNNRWEIIRKLLSFNSLSLKMQLLSYKSEIKIFWEKLDLIKNMDNKLNNLYDVEQISRPSFSFFSEYTFNLLLDGMRSLEWISLNKTFIDKLIKTNVKWEADYLTFLTIKKVEFNKICQDSLIEDLKIEDWLNQWQRHRCFIENKLSTIIERVLLGEIKTNPTLKLVESLDKYKDDIDEFYLNDMKRIHIEIADSPSAELQEKIKVEIEEANILSKFQNNITKLLFGDEINVEEQVFLFNWMNDWNDFQIEEITSFINLNNYSDISQQILDDFNELKRRNMEVILQDVNIYAHHRKERENKYNEIMFRMRKEISLNANEKKID